MHTEQELLEKGIKATVVEHPLVQHKLTLMRRKEQSSSAFRALLRTVHMDMPGNPAHQIQNSLCKLPLHFYL